MLAATCLGRPANISHTSVFLCVGFVYKVWSILILLSGACYSTHVSVGTCRRRFGCDPGGVRSTTHLREGLRAFFGCRSHVSGGPSPPFFTFPIDRTPNLPSEHIYTNISISIPIWAQGVHLVMSCGSWGAAAFRPKRMRCGRPRQPIDNGFEPVAARMAQSAVVLPIVAVVGRLRMGKVLPFAAYLFASYVPDRRHSNGYCERFAIMQFVGGLMGPQPFADKFAKPSLINRHRFVRNASLRPLGCRTFAN